MAFVSFASYSFAKGPTSCEALFQEDEQAAESNSLRILRGNEEAFYSTELDMTRTQWDQIVQEFRDKNQKLQARTVTHQGKSAVVEGNKIVIEQYVLGNRKVFEKEFEVANANGYFEAERGQLWVMPHNTGRLLIWNFAKNRLFEFELPEKGTLVDVVFDFTTNIYQQKVSIEYLPHGHVGGLESKLYSKTIEFDLVTGKEI